MSLSRRDSPFANSGLVVAVEPRTSARAAAGPLAGVELQRALERGRVRRRRRRAARAGAAPDRLPRGRAERRAAGDQLPARPRRRRRRRGASRRSSASALRDGAARARPPLRGFLHRTRVLVGVESRTSAPVRVLARSRRRSSRRSCAGLYPGGRRRGLRGRHRQRRARRRARRRGNGPSRRAGPLESAGERDRPCRRGRRERSGSSSSSAGALDAPGASAAVEVLEEHLQEPSCSVGDDRRTSRRPGRTGRWACTRPPGRPGQRLGEGVVAEGEHQLDHQGLVARRWLTR